jgi:hypothetical protein
MLSVNLPVRTLLVFPFFIKSFNTVGISPTVSLSKKQWRCKTPGGDVTRREISFDTTDAEARWVLRAIVGKRKMRQRLY